jgi:hypothetical protein
VLSVTKPLDSVDTPVWHRFGQKKKRIYARNRAQTWIDRHLRHTFSNIAKTNDMHNFHAHLRHGSSQSKLDQLTAPPERSDRDCIVLYIQTTRG